MNKWNVISTLILTMIIVSLMTMYPWYRYIIMVLLTPTVLMILVRWYSKQLNELVLDWAIRSEAKQEIIDRALSLDAKSRLIEERLLTISTIDQFKISTHRPINQEMRALPDGNQSRSLLPDLVSMANLRISHSLHQIVVGIDQEGRPLVLDFTKWIHTIIAGATGSGKSNFAHVILSQILMARENVLVDLIDLGSNTFLDYGLPCAMEQKELVAIFKRWINEFKRRRELFGQTTNESGLVVQSLEEYNRTANDTLPYSIMIIEEGADLFSSTTVVDSLGQLLRKARKHGLQIVFITQSATADDIPTKFRGQFQTRIQFPVKEKSLKGMLADLPGASLDQVGRSVIDTNADGKFNVQTPEINAETILKARDVYQKGFVTEVPKTEEIIDLHTMNDGDNSLWPDVEKGTVRERLQSFADKMFAKGHDLSEIQPVEVVKHLGLSGNGRDYRIWEEISQKNGTSQLQ